MCGLHADEQDLPTEFFDVGYKYGKRHAMCGEGQSADSLGRDGAQGTLRQTHIGGIHEYQQVGLVATDNRRIAFGSSTGVYGHNLGGEGSPGFPAPPAELINHSGAGGVIAAQSIANAQDYHTAHRVLEFVIYDHTCFYEYSILISSLLAMQLHLQTN
jgi:hypothetical protein